MAACAAQGYSAHYTPFFPPLFIQAASYMNSQTCPPFIVFPSPPQPFSLFHCITKFWSLLKVAMGKKVYNKIINFFFKVYYLSNLGCLFKKKDLWYLWGCLRHIYRLALLISAHIVNNPTHIRLLICHAHKHTGRTHFPNHPLYIFNRNSFLFLSLSKLLLTWVTQHSLKRREEKIYNW